MKLCILGERIKHIKWHYKYILIGAVINIKRVSAVAAVIKTFCAIVESVLYELLLAIGLHEDLLIIAAR